MKGVGWGKNGNAQWYVCNASVYFHICQCDNVYVTSLPAKGYATGASAVPEDCHVDVAQTPLGCQHHFTAGEAKTGSTEI